jgi:hypothetical protein
MRKFNTPKDTPTGLDRMEKKTPSRTTRKMEKLDHNNERAQTASQN